MAEPAPITLAPMVHKLLQRSRLETTERNAILNLPHRLEKLDRDAYLIREGETSDNCTVLLSGFVARTKIARGCCRHILAIHLHGDLVGLPSVLLEAADHNIQALTPISVAYIPHDAIKALAETYVTIGQALWRDVVAEGAMFREWIFNLGRRNARQRIAHLLCELSVRQEAAGLCEKPGFEWQMTQEEMAEATGMTVVHVNRTLSGLRNDGLITTSRFSITIRDWPGLQTAGDFNPAYLHHHDRPRPGSSSTR